MLVGVGTVLADDPSSPSASCQRPRPARVVLDTHLRTPPSRSSSPWRPRRPTLVFHGRLATASRRRALERAGAELVEVRTTKGGRVDLARVLGELGRRDIVRLLCEGGAGVHGSMLARGHADRVAIYLAPRLLGDPQAIPFARGGAVKRMADALELASPRVRRLGDDLLVTGEVGAWTAYTGGGRLPHRARTPSR